LQLCLFRFVAKALGTWPSRRSFKRIAIALRGPQIDPNSDDGYCPSLKKTRTTRHANPTNAWNFHRICDMVFEWT